MDKTEDGLWEETEEELYALLGKALEEEPRLQVSEKLIQKTLKRAEETPAETGCKEKSYKTYYRLFRYAGVAAAVLLLAVGVRSIGEGVLTKDGTAEKEFSSGGFMRNGESCADTDVTEYLNSAEREMPEAYHYVLESVSGAEKVPEDEPCEVGTYVGMETHGLSDFSEYEKPEMTASGTRELYGEDTDVILSETFETWLLEYGIETNASGAVYWDLGAGFREDWEALVTECMPETEETADVVTEKPYFAMDRSLFSDELLQFAVEIQTADGTCWLVMGERLYFLWR